MEPFRRGHVHGGCRTTFLLPKPGEHMADRQESPDHSMRVPRQDEVEALAKANSITVAQTRELMRRHGLDRQTLEREARNLA